MISYIKKRQKEPEASQPPVFVVPRCVVGVNFHLEAATAVSIVISAASTTAAQKQDDPDYFTAAISTKERAVAVSTTSAAAAQKQDNPDDVVTSASVVVRASTICSS